MIASWRIKKEYEFWYGLKVAVQPQKQLSNYGGYVLTSLYRSTE
jgi:hypothetical protein